MGSSTPVRWRSPLGIATIIFLLYGVFNVGAAIVVPTLDHLNGAVGMQARVVSDAADSKVLGRDIMQLATDDKGFNSYIVAYMDTMCWMMMSFGILQIGLAWFGLRRGQTWALWTMVTADLMFIPYLAAWTSIYSRAGVPVTEVLLSFNGFWIMLPVAIVAALILGWIGLKRMPGVQGTTA